MAISKSMIKAMGCGTYYAAYYLTPNAVVRQIESPLARAGTDFHRYRQEYVEHLVKTDQVQDYEWSERWLDENAVAPDARALIAGDRMYAIDPQYVVGCELFMSVDENFRYLEMTTGRNKPGYVSQDPRALLSGTVDLLEMRGREATVTDWKSGWLTAAVSDDEPPLYAALVFASFPQVDVVHFRWEFPRVRAEKAGGTYTREDMKWIHSHVRGEAYRDKQMRARHAEGGNMGVNPYAGLCAFCALKCPLRVNATRLDLVIPPVQDPETARQVGSILYAAEQVAGMARSALRPFLEQRGPTLPLSADYELELKMAGRSEYPLPDALAMLGIVIDEEALPKCEKGQKQGQPLTPRWDVPIRSLLISASKLHNFADAKFRKGMREELDAVSKRKAVSTIRVRRLNEADRIIAGDSDEED